MMAAPGCLAYAVTVNKVRNLIGSERATPDLRRYLASYRGAKFDQLIDRNAQNEFTSEDFVAVGKLSVHVLRTARLALRGDALDEVRHLLASVPSDLDIWDVRSRDYEAVLGPRSPAWKLWQLLFDLQKGARNSGRGVTAGKLLHGKRPRLILIFDRRIGQALAVSQRNNWEAYWCVTREPQIRSSLRTTEAVNLFEAPAGRIYCAAASFSGWLIHETSGSLGGWGRRLKRSGCAAQAAASTPARRARTIAACP
jgi:hypothetical protein